MAMKLNKTLLKILIFSAILVIVLSIGVSAEPPLPIPKIGLEIDTADNPEDVALSIQILFLLTILSLAPALLNRAGIIYNFFYNESCYYRYKYKCVSTLHTR
ncbi:MAG: fliP [Clostridia bacterium]|nr:fliP [Clostridia bacterium]